MSSFQTAQFTGDLERWGECGRGIIWAEDLGVDVLLLLVGDVDSLVKGMKSILHADGEDQGAEDECGEEAVDAATAEGRAGFRFIFALEEVEVSGVYFGFHTVRQ